MNRQLDQPNQSPPAREVWTKLAGSPGGRVVLHLCCLLRDGKIRWHLQGVRREMGLFLT